MRKVVIIGCGFAGLTLARKLDKKIFSVTVVDKNNYHQFPPLLYQVAISGMEPGSICFPIRSVFAKSGIRFSMAAVLEIDRDRKKIRTSTGEIGYDYLVIAAGTTTNYFGNEQIRKNAFPMKTAEDALELRNRVLCNLEDAVIEKDPQRRECLLNVVIVGGGATGVEIAGALSELRKYVVPDDFPELAGLTFRIHLVEGSGKLLKALSGRSSEYALHSLREMGVDVRLGNLVTGYDGHTAVLNDGTSIPTALLIWVSGVTAERLGGIPDTALGPGGRIITDTYSCSEWDASVFAVGDIAITRLNGTFIADPQVAPVAIQQARNLAFNFKAMERGGALHPFVYKNPGTMATIGRNRAVADIGKLHLNGLFAWLAWLVIHLRAILGVKNKIIILLDWIWNYFSFRNSIGLIFHRDQKKIAGISKK